MNKQQLQQDILELQEHLEEMQKALAAMPDKWGPRGGGYIVGANGAIVGGLDSYGHCREFGTEYATREQAEKAAKAMRARNRLLAYVAEFAPDWEPDWLDSSEPKAFIIYRVESGKYDVKTVDYPILGVVYMPYYVANNLAAKINSGEVEL